MIRSAAHKSNSAGQVCPGNAAINALAVKHDSPDVVITNHGSVFLFGLMTERAKNWVRDHVSDDALWFGPSLAVDRRYALDIANGMIDAGLEVV